MSSGSKQKFYRFEDVAYGSYNEDITYPTPYIQIDLLEFEEIKKTPRGKWVADPHDHRLKHFIRDRARKKFAYPTVNEAKESFTMRKKRQIEILEDQLSRAKIALDKINSYS